MVSQSTYDQLSRQRAKRVAKAEKATGYVEGVRFWNGKPYSVGVRFYPTEKWFCYCMEDDGKPDVQIDMTDEIWAEMAPLKL